VKNSGEGGGSITVTHNGEQITVSKAGECITHLIDCTSSVEFALGTDMVVLKCTVVKELLGRYKHPYTAIDVVPLQF